MLVAVAVSPAQRKGVSAEARRVGGGGDEGRAARGAGRGKDGTHCDLALCALDKVAPGAHLVVCDAEPASDARFLERDDGLVELVEVGLDGGEGGADLCEGVVALLGIWTGAVVAGEGGGER